MPQPKNVKKRYWAFVLYPESAPDDWRDLLQQTGLQCAISPLHDMDLDPTGTVKKAHYHIIWAYSGPTTFNVVKNLTSSLGQPIPQPLESVRGYYRYFTHKDNPDKYQYDDNDISVINGFDIINYVELTRNEVLQIKVKIMDLIVQADIKEYADLLELLRDSVMMTELDIASSNTLLFDRYLASRRHRLSQPPMP